MFGLMKGTAPLTASPINPIVFKKEFEEARKTAEVVAHVRVLAVSCVDKAGEEGKELTLQLALHVLQVDKGPAKKGQLLTVTHQVRLPRWAGTALLRLHGRRAAIPLHARRQG
jgi:hypothetical protein